MGLQGRSQRFLMCLFSKSFHFAHPSISCLSLFCLASFYAFSSFLATEKGDELRWGGVGSDWIGFLSSGVAKKNGVHQEPSPIRDLKEFQLTKRLIKATQPSPG